MKSFPYADKMINSKLININRTCDLVAFTFLLEDEKKIFLHAQCFIRIFDNERLIICSQYMLRKSQNLKKWQKFDWATVGNTLFDDTILEYKEKLFSLFVEKITFHSNDLRIFFNENFVIDIFVHITESDDPNYSENYRFFEEDETKDHFVI